MQKYEVWQNAWKAGYPQYQKPLELTLPDGWEVEYHAMNGDSWPALSKAQMKDAIDHPIGCDSILEMAKNGKEAVIVFDDVSRGTQVRDIAEIVLEELLEGGIGKDHIRFICAVGTHGAQTRLDFVQKLGDDIVSQYPVFNHNPFYGNVAIGVDKWGTEVTVNAEFWDCDVRIGIGSVTPHPMNGYGGGGKLIFPGISGVDTTISNHSNASLATVGDTVPSELYYAIESMAKMVDPFFKIDVCINAGLETIALFAGDPAEEYRQAVKVSAEANAMEPCAPKDIVIVNANAKFNEANISVRVGNKVLKEGGDVVMINHCPCGQVVHYLYNAFGLARGGPLYAPYNHRAPEKHGRLIVFTPYPSASDRLLFNHPDKVVFARTWDEVMELLGSRASATVSILSDGSISYFPELLNQT